MSLCPVCGQEVSPVQYFNVTSPAARKQMLLHNAGSPCPLSTLTPPIKDTAFNTDCLIGMNLIPDGSIDLILSDLPYGTTRNKWDTVIPFKSLWAQYERIIKDAGAIILFADGLFTAQLIQSNAKLWRYNLIWDKGQGTDFLNSNVKPLKCHEDIVVFYKKKPTYNKQFWFSKPYKVTSGSRSENYDDYAPVTTESDGRRNPLTVLRFYRDREKLHPTQKPIALLEYLIRTYSNEGDTVLDSCFGSGSTLIAAINAKRACVGFEKEERYFNIAAERIQQIGGKTLEQ